MPPSMLNRPQPIAPQDARPSLQRLWNHIRIFHFLALAFIGFASANSLTAQLVQVPAISTVAGTPGAPGTSGDGGRANSAKLGFPASVAFNRAGDLYIVDNANNNIRKVAASTGIITTIAGNGTAGFSGDGSAATSAALNQPAAIALDAAGNLYIADTDNSRIRKVNATTGMITTIAGNGSTTSSGDGSAATSAGLSFPGGIALDNAGNIFFTDNGERGVREINAGTGIITTVVSNATTPNPLFGSLYGVAIDGSGNLFIGDNGAHKVFKYTTTGTVTAVAGNGTAGSSGDGASATSAQLNWPQGVVLDTAGNIYISDEKANNVRKVSASTGTISTVAGTATQGYNGDYGAATQAELNDPSGVALDSSGNLYIADGLNGAVREVSLLIFPPTSVAETNGPFDLILQTTAAETISSFTVSTSQGNKKEFSVYAVNGCAADGVTSLPAGTICTLEITFDPAYPGLRNVPLHAVTSAGNASIGLIGTGIAPLAAITPGTMSTIAGELSPPNCNAYSGPATSGPICNPSAGAVDFAGNVYVASYYSNTVSRIDTSGNITVIAGTGAGGLSGVGGVATSATFDRPADVAVDAAGNVYFIGETAQQVFRIDAVTHILTSVAGNGDETYSGDNGPATQASLNYPEGLALDTQGNLYIEDHNNNLIRKVDTAGIITTVAGNPATAGQSAPAYGGDGGPATQANLALSGGGVYASYDSVSVDGAGNLYIGDSGHHVVREVTTDGIIHTIAGNNALGAGFSGDGGAATSAQLDWPMGVAIDPGGDVYIADFSNNRIRKIDAATQTISTVAGDGYTGSGTSGPATQVDLNGPQKVTLDGLGNLYVADTKNNLVREVNVSTPTLTFPTPTTIPLEDTTDGTLTAIVSNIGNAALTIPQPTTGTNASISGSSFSFLFGPSGACPSEGPGSPSAGTLGEGSSCGLAVVFEPIAVGLNTGSVVLTDNSLNAPSPFATQTILLSGMGVAGTGVLAIAPTMQAFASTAVGSTSSALASTITNSTTQAIYLSSGSLTDSTDFAEKDNCGGILSASGGTCTVTFTFTPQTSGALTSTYAIHDLNHPESPLTVVLSGNGTATAPQATLSPSSSDFGSITTGTTSASQTFTLSNPGAVLLGISSISLTGANPGSFSIVTDTCVATTGLSAKPAQAFTAHTQAMPSDIAGLPSSSSCQITIVFSPASAASAAATLTIVDDAGTQSSTLTGTGMAAAPPPAPIAALTPATANFGTLAQGTASTAQTFKLTNSGNAVLTITGITLGGANASDFALSANSCGGTLAASATCTVAVTLTPSEAGNETATLTVSDNAAGSPQTSTLTGAGAALGDFVVTASPVAQSVSAGALIAYSVNVSSTNGSFTSPVALTATGLPPGATVTFSPASVTPGSSAAESNMAIQTTRQQASAKNGRPLWPLEAPAFAALLLLLPAKRWRSGRRWMNLACFIALLGMTASAIGCGGGFALPSTARTYTITVTGTSGSDTHSTTVTLTVQ